MYTHIINNLIELILGSLGFFKSRCADKNDSYQRYLTAKIKCSVKYCYPPCEGY